MFLVKLILQIRELFIFFPFVGNFTFYNIRCDVDVFRCCSFARQLRLDEYLCPGLSILEFNRVFVSGGFEKSWSQQSNIQADACLTTRLLTMRELHMIYTQAGEPEQRRLLLLCGSMILYCKLSDTSASSIFKRIANIFSFLCLRVKTLLHNIATVRKQALKSVILAMRTCNDTWDWHLSSLPAHLH